MVNIIKQNLNIYHIFDKNIYLKSLYFIYKLFNLIC